MILTTVFVCWIFIWLGIWQLHRASEKSRMLLQEQRAQKQAPVTWDNPKKLRPYQRVAVQGRYLPSIFLLDNQHYRHQLGVQVYAPLLLANDSVLMVDRGWIQNQNPRQTNLDLKIPAGLLQIRGSIYYPSSKQWILGDEIEQIGDKRFIVERFNPQLLSQLLQKSVYPFIIRLDSSQPDGFIRDWNVVTMRPERHKGYALQWFAMATVIFILFIALNLKKENETIKQ